MFRTIWTHIRNFFKPSNIVLHTNVRTTAMDDYRQIVKDIQNATSLSQLLLARQNIRKLQQYIINNGEEVWGRPFIIDLNKRWKVMYQFWKRKLRGY